MASFNSTVIARVAAALYDLQLGNETMDWALEQANASGGVASVVQSVYNADFAGMTYAQVAQKIVANVGISGAVASIAEGAVVDVLNAGGAGHEGQSIVTILNAFAGMTAHSNADVAAAARAFNAQISAAVAYAAIDDTTDVPVHTTAGKLFTLTAETAAGADVMRLTGDQDVRIDFTNPANQVIGLDLDGDGVIEFNGGERSITGVAANFEIVDAYARNPLDHTDTANNFLGDIYYDGTAFDGDGVSTNGNIFLGGLGTDTAFGGVGNDFLAGGGIAQGRTGRDYLSGNRNADFFFAEFSGIDATDGSTLLIDGGITSDDESAGNNQSAEDNDWLLFEASDDDEPVRIWLNNDNTTSLDDRDGADGLFDDMGRVLSRSGESMQLDDVENVDASGNLYGFLDDVDVEIGGRAVDTRDEAGASNYGIGSSAQLWISGSNVSNIIIAGYDNDYVEGRDGADLLMGGNLNHLNNPNLTGIWNNGRDELIGGADADDIVFETDGGIYEGGAEQGLGSTGSNAGPTPDDDGSGDTLWLTREAFGTRTVSDVTSDGTVRMDLAVGLVGGLANAAGYGGADKNAATGNYTSDQTLYKAGYARAQVQDFDNVIATGLGSVDYLAAGANDPELVFANQQNHFAFTGNLDLRGNGNDNTLYAVGGADVLEGRMGNDALSGGDGNDDFIFFLQVAEGDGVDVIHRQTDANGDNLWDTDAAGNGLFERDFNIGGSSTTGPSKLIVDLGTTDLSSPDVALTSFTIKIGGATGTVFSVTDSAALIAATSAAAVAALVNTAYQAIDAKVTAVAIGNTIVVTDTGGRDISDTVAEGYAVGGVVSNGAFSALATYQAPGTSTTKDRLIYNSYEDRLDAESTNDDATIGSQISLGADAYAEDLVANFEDEDGDGVATTRLAEDQAYTLRFTNLTTEDIVTIAVNGVKYTLQVGVDLDGNPIAAEDGEGGDTQAGIQTAFLARLNAFINSFMDDDTSAGEVASAFNGVDTLTLTQADYQGEETVFMVTPVVTLGNQSGGEPAKVTVTNVSQHEVELLDFDGRNGELNETNVLFWGAEKTNRAELSTAKAAGDTLTGYEAIVVDVGANNLQDVIFGTTTAVVNNTITNTPIAAIPNGVAIHGDDFLIGGAGLDTISGGTGDDRVEGSVGGNGTSTWDTLDGGKNFYAVQVLGEAQARVYVLNHWESQNPSKVAALSSLTISSITLIDQTESGSGAVSGRFDDTLQFTQKLFTPGVTRFTITLDNFTLTGGVVELRNDGAGTVGVDMDGNGVIESWTRFTNFENIRTVSGTGNAIANDGQGNDTLNVSALSSATTGANGVMYNLTNDVVNGFAAGSVTYSANAHASLTKPAITDFESLVIRVDGVESVIGGTGDDLLVIDETEAAKNNTFTGDLGDDRIIYQNDLGTIVGEPTITIAVDNVAASLGGTDTVTSTAGRVGTTQAVDTLNGVEFISLEANTAESVRENDVLDVSAINGAQVSYVDGTVKSGGTTHVTIDGLVQIERVNGGGGNDTVFVADSALMDDNAREDIANGTPDQNILFMTYLDFDDLNTNATTRKSFAAQVADDTVTNVINQGEFTFALSNSGAGTETGDRVDYSAEDGRIIVPVGQGSATAPQYVVVSGDADTSITDQGSRVDILRSVEEIVAATGPSVMDFTGVGAARQITFQYAAPSGNPAENQVLEQTVRIADATGNTVAGLTGFIEKWTYNKTTSAVADATWNQIEGGDSAETVIYQGSEDLVNQSGLDHRFTTDVLTLRGGANEVRYSPLETSVSAVITVTEENLATTNVSEGLINAVVTFQDGLGVNAPSGTFLGGMHTITSHTSDNTTASGSLKIEGSQDAEDVVQFAGLGSKTFILGSSPGVITVNIGTSTSMTLTGFEFIQDAASNDLYNFASLVGVTGLTLLDTAGDHDVIKVNNDAAAAAFNGGIAGNTTIDLGELNEFFLYDFDVLDLSAVNLATLTTINGSDGTEVIAPAVQDGGGDDELVIGTLGTAATTTVNDFEAVVVSNATIASHGTSFVLNTSANSLVIGAKTLQFNGNMNTLSFAGTVFATTPVPHATTGVAVTMVGNEAVTIWGSDAADTITTNGGNDTLRGGMGNDTLSGGFQAAVGPSYVATFTGGASVLTANGDNVTVAGATITAAAAPAAFNPAAASNQIATGADSDQVGAMFASLNLATWVAALQTAGATAAEAGALTGVTYNAVSNQLSFAFNNSANAATILITDFQTGQDLTGGTITVTEAFTALAPAVDSADTFVFEATAALNGADTLNQVDLTDTFNFSAFLGAGNGGGTVETFTYSGAGTFSPAGATDLVVVANKGGLAASDFAAAATAGKFNIADGDIAVFAVSADATGAGGTAGNQSWLLYYVSNGATAGVGDLTVSLVGTVNSTVELTAADVAGML
ncbi:hypothetical protein [Aquabacterium humicola]|uniref:hypothetical protein n=1 Tax=Aquabacterium humicola TaxID=3237377 RepID=UPI002543A674|nr:hypothetical protein [Rubrivivax pictus]